MSVVTLDNRYITNTKVAKLLLPCGMDNVRKATKASVIFNSLDFNLCEARSKAAEFQRMYCSSGRPLVQIRVDSYPIVAIMSVAIPNGVQMKFAYKPPELFGHSGSQDIMSFIFGITQGAPCLMTNNCGNFCVDWEVNGNHVHMVIRKVKREVNPANLLYMLNVGVTDTTTFTSGVENVTKIIHSKTEAIFK